LGAIFAISAVTMGSALDPTTLPAQGQTISNLRATRTAPPPVLFVANYDGGYVSFFPVADDGDARPAGAISGGVSSPQGLCFDSSGDLWVCDEKIMEYAQGALSKPVAVPRTEISLPGAPATGGSFSTRPAT
jgi:hypothetical protein